MKPPMKPAQLNKIFRDIFTNLPDCLLVVDEDLHIVLCNWKGNFSDIPEDLRRQNLKCYEILYPGQKDPCPNCPVKDVLKTYREITVKKHDPRAGHLEIRAFPISGSNRRVALVAEQLCNVSSAEKLREKLKASNNKLQTLFNLMPQTIFELDKNGVIVFANDAGLNNFGYSRTEWASGIRFSRLFIPEQRRQSEDYLKQVFKGLGSRSREYTAMRKDGTTFPTMIFVDPEYREGGIIGAVGMLVDLTEHKALEEQRVQTQKMEAVARMAQGLAHDFNNLLLIVSGYSELLLKKLEAPDLRGWTEAIRDAGSRAKVLTEQLQDLGQESIGRRAAVDLNATLNTLEKLMRQALGQGIALGFELQPGLPPARANPEQLEQIILNLTINARDAMPHGGLLTVKTEHIVDPAGTPYVKLIVSDNGYGMDEQTKPHIFEPFFTTKERGKGTGLGLSTVYAIVKIHGGKIEVDSAPGQGTTFHIFLPCP